MPTYEYACRSCGEHVEVVQSFSDDPLTTCPACGGQLRKVFGSIGIAFKGSGFYRTDSRPKEAKEAKEAKEPKEPKEAKEPKEPKEKAESTSDGGARADKGSKEGKRAEAGERKAGASS